MAESPTDIASVLKNSQDVLDAAVATVSATRTTQNTLEKNIELTDKKIGIHNVDEEAHEDIRAQLSRMIDEPIVTGPSTVEHEVAGTWTFTATPLVNFVTVEKFVVTLADGTSEDVITSTGTATWTHTFTDTTGSGSSTAFSVYAYGSSFRSVTVVKELTITHHYPPSMDEVVCTLPEICNGGDTIEWSIDGITDVDGDLKSISASVDNSYVTLSQRSDLKQGTTYKLTVADAAGVNGGTFHVVFTALDDFGMTNSISYTVKINARPNVNNITYVIPTRINPSSTNTLTVSGATKPETGSSDTITYSISCDNSALTFSKTSGIKQNETVNVAASSSAVAGSAYNITLTFKDENGGVSTKVISGTINRTPDVSGISLGLPAKFVPGKTYSFVAAGATDPDADTVTYSITSNEGNFTFSKTSNIAAGSTVTFTVPSTVTRGATYSWSLTATDKYGASASAKQSCTINTIRSTSEFTFRARFAVATNTYNPVTINSTGVAFVPSTSSATNAVTLWCEPVNSTNGTAYTAKWTLTNSKYNASADTVSAGISGTWATSTIYTAPSEKQLARGEAFTATVTLNDGYEDIIVPVGKFYQARLPVTTNATITPSRLFTSGKSNTFKVTGVTNPDTAAGITGKFSGYSSWGSLAVTNVTSDSEGFNTASYTANDISSKNYEVTVASDVEPGSDLYLVVTIQSITGATTTLTKNFVANRLPVVSACTITAKHTDYNGNTVTETIAVGKTLVAVPKTAYTLTLNGATDPEGETLTYRYGSASALTSNTAGSACTGSSYSITNSQWVSRGQSSVYGFSAVDYSYAFNVAEFTVLINNTLDVSKCNPVSQLPAKLVPGKSYSLKITGATSSTSDKTITYTITNVPTGFTFSKTTGISNGDTVTLTLASSVAYKSDFTWTLNAFDGYEAPTAITQSVTTASALSADDIKLYVSGTLRNSNDFVVAPGGTFTFTATPLTTSSNDAITVTWSTNNSNATFTSSTNGTGVYHAPTAAQLARGSYVTCTATFTDGYTTVSKSFKIYQNSLPVVSSAKMVYSGQITAGYSKSFTLSGITDTDVTAGRITSSGSAAALTVPSISSSGQTVTFTGASSTATPASTFTITPSSTATAGGSVTVAAKINDGTGESASTSIGITLNKNPDLSSLTLDMSYTDYKGETVKQTLSGASASSYALIPGMTYKMVVSGATDPESETLTYTVGAVDGITVTNGTNVSSGSTVTIKASDSITRGSIISFTVKVKDASNGSSTKTINGVVNELPDVSKLTVSGIPEYLVPGKSYSVTFSGASDSGVASTYALSSISTGLTFSKTSGIAANSAVTMTVANTVSRGSNLSFGIVVSDIETSITTTKTYKVNQIISADDVLVYLNGTQLTTDAVHAPSASTTIKFAIKDKSTFVDADSQTLSISSFDTTISTTNKSISGNTVTLNAPTESVLARGKSWTATAVITDGYESVSKTITFHQNTLPDLTNLKATWSGQITPGGAVKAITLSGATDADITAGYKAYKGYSETALTISNFTVSLATSSKSFTDTSASFSLASSVAAGTAGTFTVTYRDSCGETSSKSFSFTANKNPVVTAGEFSFSFTNSDGSVRTQSYGATTAITNLRIVPGSTITFKPSKVTDPEGEAVTYSIAFPDLTVTNGSNIAEGGSATLTVPSNLTRGSTHTGTITCTDASGGKSTVSITAVVNQKPDLSSLKNSLASKLLPGNTYSFTFSGGTDADDTIKYSLSNIPNGLTFSKTSNIANGESISVTLASTVTRGQTYTWTVSASDIEGTVSTTQSLYVRKILDVSSIKTYINGHEFTDNCVISSSDSVPVSVTPLTDPEGESLAVTWAMAEGTKAKEPDTYFISSTSTNGTATIDFVGVYSTTVLTVTATFDNGYETVSKDFYVWVDTGPDVTSMICTMTGTLVPGSAKSLQFSGITNEYANYVCKNGLVGTGTVTWNGASSTFSSTSIDKTESGITYATATPLASLARGSTAYWYMSVTDNAGAVSTKQFSAKIGRVPVMTNASITAVITDHSAAVTSTQTVSGASGGSWIVPPGSTLKITAQGASDPDNLGFSAASISVDSSFKSSYVSSLTSTNDGSTVTATLILKTIARGSTFNIYYNATDIDGESVTRTISCIVPAVTATDDVFSFLGSKMSNSSLTNYYCRHYFTDLTSLAGPIKTFFSSCVLFTDPNGYDVSDVTLSETTKVSSGDVGTSDVEFVFFAFDTSGKEQYSASANQNSSSSTTLKPLSYDGFNCGFYGTKVYVDTAANATITATWKTPYEQVSDSVLVFMVPWYHAANMLGGWDSTLEINGGYGGVSGTITVGTPTIGEVYSVITNGDAKYADTGAAASTVSNGPNVKITSTYNLNITGDNTTYPVVYRTDSTTYEVVGTSVTINILSTATTSGTKWLNAGYVYAATTMVPELQVRLKDSIGTTLVRCSINQYTPYDSNSALATWAATDWNKFKVQVNPVYKTPAPSLTYPTASCTVSGLDTAGSTWTAKWSACDTMGVQMDGNGAACSTLLLNSDGTPKKWLDGNSWSGYYGGGIRGNHTGGGAK